MAEHAYFEDLVSTYGTTFDTWQYDRDRRLGLSTQRKRRSRRDIPAPEVLSGTNSCESGRTVQTRLEEMNLKQ